jgi:hypothetical protein
MLGWGCRPILEALPMPLGSTVALFNPPAFAGPRGIPLIGHFLFPPNLRRAQIPRARRVPLAQMKRQEGSGLWTLQ